MFLGKVLKPLVPPHKHPHLKGHRILWIQPIEGSGNEVGGPILAVDNLGAGAGERVILVSAMEASFAVLPRELVPADAAVIGILDSHFHESIQENSFNGRIHDHRKS